MVAVRIRPLRNDEPQRALYAVNKKVPNPFLPTMVCYQRRRLLFFEICNDQSEGKSCVRSESKM
jgi:hypothetical protein